MAIYPPRWLRSDTVSILDIMRSERAERRAKNQAFNAALKSLCAEHRVTGEGKRKVGRLRARYMRLLVSGRHTLPFPPPLGSLPDDCQFPADQVVALYTLIYG